MSVDNGTPRKPLNAREREEHLYDLILALIARSNAKPEGEVRTFDTYSTGPHQGKWHAKLVIPREEGESREDYNTRCRVTFEETDELVTSRNADETREEMNKRLSQSVAQLSGKRGKP